MNAVVSQTLRCLMSDVTDLSEWKDYLPTVEMVINSLPNRSTGYSPFYLMYGYHPVLPVELVKGDELWGALFGSAPRSLSPRIPSNSHSPGEVGTPSTNVLRPSRFLQQHSTTCRVQDPQTGQEHRILTREHTRAHTSCKTQPRIPKWCSLQTTR